MNGADLIDYSPNDAKAVEQVAGASKLVLIG